MVQSIIAPDDGDFNMDTLVGINLLFFKLTTLSILIAVEVYNFQMIYYRYLSKNSFQNKMHNCIKLFTIDLSLNFLNIFKF